MTDTETGLGASILQGLLRRIRLVAWPALFLALTGFFAWNATKGDRGLVVSAERQALLKRVEADRADAAAEKDLWERRVTSLRANRLDPDALDEQARSMLNLADPNDVVIQYTAKDRPRR